MYPNYRQKVRSVRSFEPEPEPLKEPAKDLLESDEVKIRFTEDDTEIVLESAPEEAEEEYPEEAEEEYPEETESEVEEEAEENFEGVTSDNIHIYEDKCKNNLRCQKKECEEIDALIMHIVSEKSTTGETLEQHAAELKEVQKHINKCHGDIEKCDHHVNVLNERLELVHSKLNEAREAKLKIKERLENLQLEDAHLHELLNSIKRQKERNEFLFE